MKAVIVLGNPGEQYRLTRHNVAVQMAELWLRHPSWKQEGNYLLAKRNETLVVFPQTFMNLSGKAVFSLMKRYSLLLNDLLAVCDDVNLPLGSIRIRPSGGHGGHNGLRSIIDELGSAAFPRMRLGVGGGHLQHLHDFVLEPFAETEMPTVETMLGHAAQAAQTFIKAGLNRAMNEFNRTCPANGAESPKGGE